MSDSIPQNNRQQLVLITGGGTGLGFGMARKFALNGYKVVITGRREDVLKDACDQIGNDSRYIVSDMTNLEGLSGLVSDIEQNIGPIDILINNAGVNMKKPIVEMEDQDILRIINTNLTSVYILTREVVKRMIPRGRGNIIMVTSMAAIYGISNVTAYSASKAGVLGLTRALAVDLAQHGIRVNAIAPGFIDSPMLRKAFDSDTNRRDRVLQRTPMQRLGEADDIAEAALYLASDASRFVTGVNLPVDGGNSIGF